MANIVLQDLTAIINHTSKFNNEFDTVHVETLLQTDMQLPPDMQWFVPNGSSVPPEALELFKATKLAMYPMSEATMLAGTENIQREASENDLEQTELLASKYILRAISIKKPLDLVSGTNNVYLLTYDYKLYMSHDKNTNINYFDFKVVLPFDGLGMIQGLSMLWSSIFVTL